MTDELTYVGTRTVIKNPIESTLDASSTVTIVTDHDAGHTLRQIVEHQGRVRGYQISARVGMNVDEPWSHNKAANIDIDGLTLYGYGSGISDPEQTICYRDVAHEPGGTRSVNNQTTSQYRVIVLRANWISQKQTKER